MPFKDGTYQHESGFVVMVKDDAKKWSKVNA